MHLTVFYRPDDSESDCSGCADADVCPKCVRDCRTLDLLADMAEDDYNKSVVNRREA